MKIKVLFFANCSEIAGCKETEIRVVEGATVGDLKYGLLDQYPDLANLQNVLSVAVNADYADDWTVLHDGDEVALIPPVSGG